MSDLRSTGRAAYRLRGPVHWRELDGEWLVCAEKTASISQVDAWSAAVLSLLEEAPADRAALRAALQAAADGEGEGEGEGAQSGTAGAGVATDAAAIEQRLDEALRYLLQQDLLTTSTA